MAKEVDWVPTDYAPLVWSLDGQMISTIVPGWSYYDYTMCVYNVSLGTKQWHRTLKSWDLPKIWAHDKSFRVMAIGLSDTVDIFEARSVLTKIKLFPTMGLEKDMKVKSFCPATYRISLSGHGQSLVIDILNSKDLLKREFSDNSCECFSSDGNLFAVSQKGGVCLWRYGPHRYSLWRRFTLQNLNLNNLQLSPTSSAIVGSSQRGLHVWRLDQPPINAHVNSNPPLVALPHHGVYTATAHKRDCTITITSLLSQSPPQTIDTGISIMWVALTGNVLLVKGRTKDRAQHAMVMAWRLTEEDGASGNRGVDIGNCIWTARGPFYSNPKFLIQGQTVVMKWGSSIMHTYHAGTGKVLEPSQAPLSPHCKWYNLQDMMYGQHYPHHRELEYGSLSENDWSVSKTALQQGWMKDPEGRHQIWIPTECRVDFSNVCWLHNITTLRLNINLQDTGGAMIIMF